MLVTDFTTQDGRGQLQPLRRTLARAFNESRDNAAKINWLLELLTSAKTDVDNDVSWSRLAADGDSLSNNTLPGLVNQLTKAVSESSTYGGDYKTQLSADLQDVRALLLAI